MGREGTGQGGRRQPPLGAILPHCQHLYPSSPCFILLLFFPLQPSLGVPAWGRAQPGDPLSLGGELCSCPLILSAQTNPGLKAISHQGYSTPTAARRARVALGVPANTADSRRLICHVLCISSLHRGVENQR